MRRRGPDENVLQAAFAFDKPREEPQLPPRSNLVVQAGAGTGKTTRIVREILEILLANPDLEPERIALVTFTEKAAAEIADRIRAAIIELANGIETGRACWPAAAVEPIIEIPEGRREKAHAACLAHIEKLDRFRSQTIHSFCQTLLRFHPIEAGLSPSFAIIQGSQQIRFYQRIWREWLRKETRIDADEATAGDWAILLNHFHRLSEIESIILDDLMSKVDLLADESYSMGSLEDFAPHIALGIEAVRALPISDIAAASEEATALLNSIRKRPLPPRGATIDDWILWFEPIEPLMQKVNLRMRASTKDALQLLVGKGSPRKTVHSRLTNHRAAETIRRVANRFYLRLAEAKEEEGFVDFDDLLFRTARLLEDDAICEELRDHYDFIFVDEFQDTDRVQARILDRLIHDREGLIPGRTMIVGDSKQSIYSFRRADPETYEQFVLAFVEEEASSEWLSRQFRSDPELVRDLNAMFTVLFDKPSSENVARPIYAPDLVPARAGDGLPLPARLTFLRAEEAGEEDESSAQEREAGAIAALIKRELESGRAPHEFAILFKRMTKAHEYAAVLEQAGIPVLVPPTRQFLEGAAAVELLSVLRAIAFPSSNAALIGAARSIYFAMTDHEMTRAILLRDGGEESLTWQSFRRAIGRYAELAQQRTVASLIDLVVVESEVGELYHLLRNGEEPRSQIARLRALALEFDLDQGGSVSDFVAEIDRRRDEQDDIDATSIDLGKEAVKLMTVHSAKGLEFDTVILPDLSATGAGREGTRAYTIENPRSLVFTGSLTPLAYDFRMAPEGVTLAEIVREREHAEIERLFYVAVTRARRDVVFVTATGKRWKSDKTFSFWGCLCEIFDKAMFEELWQPGEAVVEELAAGARSVNALFETLSPPPPGEVEDPFVAPSLAAIAAAHGPVDFNTAAPEIAALDIGTVKQRLAGSRNRIVGIVLHRMLELWDGRDATLLPTLTRAAAESGASAVDVERATARARRLATSPAAARIIRGETVAVELPIFYSGADGTTVEGRVDRLIREMGGLVVVDYKSGSRSAETAPRHDEQVARYCDAISKMTGEKVGGLLWYLENGEVVEVGKSEE